MKIEEMLKLIDAGFTKDEIIKISGVADPEEKKEIPEDTPAESAPDQVEEFKTALNGILESFKTLADDIKKSNIANARMPEQEQTSAEQILANIIAPPVKERGKN